MRSSLLDSLDSCPAQDYRVTSLVSSILTRHTTMYTSSPLLVTHVRQLEGNELGVSPLCDKARGVGVIAISVMTYFTRKQNSSTQ